MRKSTNTALYGLLSFCFGSLLALSACTKTFDDKTPGELGFTKGSSFQLAIATVGASRNYIHVDGAPQNGAALSTGSIFPGGTGNYGFSVLAGNRAFLLRDTLSTTTQAQLSFANVVGVNKNYTIFAFDTITTPKQKTVETSIVIPNDTTARIRFANFIYNPNGMPPVDVFSLYQNANVFTNVSITDVTGFVSYPSKIGVDTLYVRETGTTNLLAKVAISGLTPQRSYTVLYRGSGRALGLKTASLFANW
ncbi:MAG: hypothetical protein ACKO6Q_08655 [Bacteroidota bacterium]